MNDLHEILKAITKNMTTKGLREFKEELNSNSQGYLIVEPVISSLGFYYRIANDLSIDDDNNVIFEISTILFHDYELSKEYYLD